MGVVPYIQQYMQGLALPAELATIQAPRDASTCQRRDNALRLPGQIGQRIGLHGQRRVFHRQIQQRNIAQLDQLPPGILTTPMPDLIGTGQIKVTTAQKQRATQLCSLVEQCMRRVQIATQGRLAGTENPGLFKAHGFAGVAQILNMIDTDTGHQRQVGIHQIDRIQAPAQADFQHHGIQLGTLEQPEGCQRTHFKICKGCLAAPCIQGRKGLAKQLVRDFNTLNLYALVIAQQVGRTVNPHLEPLRLQQRSHKRTGRALAIGTRNRHHPRRRLLQPQAVRYLACAIQTHIDGRWMQLLKIGEPLAKGALGHRFAGAGGTTMVSTGAATNTGVGKPIICASRLPRRGRSS